MKIIDPRSEQRLLICALDHHKSKVRNWILANTDAIDFGSEFAKEVREVMDKQIQRGKPLGNCVDFSEMPSLSQEAQEFIRGTSKLRKKVTLYSKEEVEALVYKIKLHKRLRAAFSGLEKASSILMNKKVDEDHIQDFKATLEDTLMKIDEEFDGQPMEHIGMGQSKEDLERMVESVINPRPDQFIKTGIPTLDKLFTFARGNVVTVSANSGGGKTIFALLLAKAAAAIGHKVLYYSLEMGKDELNDRLASNLAQVEHDRIRSGQLNPREKKTIAKQLRKYRKKLRKRKGRLTIWDVKNDATPQNLEVAAKPFKFDIMIVDYITLFSSKYNDTWKMQMEYSRYFKQMAKRQNCMIIILSQLTEDEQIKYGRSIKENTDYWFYWVYGDDEEEDGQTEMKTGKARHNKKRSITLKMDLDYMTITGSLEELPVATTRDREVGKQPLTRVKSKKKDFKRTKKRLKKRAEKELGAF